MKIDAWKGDAFAAKPPKALIAALVFGPDQGLVRERADALAKSVVPDLSDPFRVAEIDGDALEKDPARLADEAAAIAMVGGRRVVRVRGVSNDHTDIFKRFLADPVGDALIVAEGGDLKPTGVRKAFEDANASVAAIGCYLDEVRDLDNVVRRTLRDEGIAAGHDAIQAIVSRLGSDRGVTRRELEKLALYAADTKRLSEVDVLAILGDESELGIDRACDAAADGDRKRLDSMMERLWAAGVAPSSVLRGGLGHFQRMLQLKAMLAEGGSAEQAMARMRPPVKGPRANSLKAQVSRWTTDDIAQALDQLYEAEALTRTTGVPSEAATARAMLGVADMMRGPR